MRFKIKWFLLFFEFFATRMFKKYSFTLCSLLYFIVSEWSSICCLQYRQNSHGFDPATKCGNVGRLLAILRTLFLKSLNWKTIKQFLGNMWFLITLTKFKILKMQWLTYKQLIIRVNKVSHNIAFHVSMIEIE